MSNLKTTTKTSGIQVIARASAIMRALGAHPTGLSLAAIAAEVDLPRSTVQRIIAALEVEDLVESIGAAGGYRLGPALGVLIHQAHTDIVSLVRKALETLHHDVNETVALACLRSQEVHVIDRLVSEQELRIVFPLGISTPCHASSSGKVLLSTLDDDSIREWLPEEPEKLTANTLNREQLIEQVQDIRLTGIAEDYEEHTVGICAMGILIPTFMGAHAVSIISPKSRYLKAKKQYREALEKFRATISQQLPND